jgi:hypothetical protein
MRVPEARSSATRVFGFSVELCLTGDDGIGTGRRVIGRQARD